MLPLWLPELVPFESCAGDWTRYVDLLYSHFKRDFVDSKPVFRGSTLRLKRHPIEQGKEATFWHMISEGKTEVERVPDMRRCERICWPKLLIERAPCEELRTWPQERNGEPRIAISVEDFSYIVILAERGIGSSRYYLPWTTFYVEWEHQRRKYEKEWQKAKLL